MNESHCLPSTATALFALSARFKLLLAAACVLPALAGCAGGILGMPGPDYAPPVAITAAAWQAQHPDTQVRPHAGSTQRLAQWWSQFNDPLLGDLIAAAQEQSGTLAQAAAAIERSRAEAITAGVAALPSVDGIASINRSAFTLGGPLAYRQQSQFGVQAGWEIDLFGGLARQREAAQARVEADVAQWHEARVSLAAEVANAYVALRHCEIQVVEAQADAHSRAESARIIAISGRAGLQGAAAVALAQAGAAESAGMLVQRRAQCDVAVKGLVALTAIEERDLRARLAQGGNARLPQPAQLQIASLPARVIEQRPDIAAAERRLAAASADIGAAEGNNYPRLSLSGSITPTRIAIGSAPALNLTTWSIGPSVSLPLLDGGRRRANVDAFRAQYAAAESAYRAKVRGAVREVEEALVQLASAAEREASVTAGAGAYRANFDAAQAKLRAGLGSVLELEEARRLSLAADAGLVTLAQERLAAWIALYRAAGGGWEPNVPLASR